MSIKLINSIVISTLLLISIKFSDGFSKHPVNIIVSLDGFHYKYFSELNTPTLLKLKERGASAVYMNNVFPTKTFPNHFTIATGQYVEEHGVLDSNLFDTKLNKSVNYSEDLFSYKKTVEPIWIINEKAGDGRYSGVMMWPGSEFKYSGKKAKFEQVFDSSVSFKARIDKIIEWISHPTTPANLILMYFEEPDISGHVYGPNSTEVELQLKKCDAAIKYLLYKLNNIKINNYNLIVLSDHGMSNVYFENIINLDTIIDSSIYNYYGTSPILQIYPRPGQYNKVLTTLKNASNKTNSHFRVFTKDTVPANWHYKDNTRVSPLLLVADVGYVFNDIFSTLSYFERTYNIQYGPGSRFGTHGYDPVDDLMHPIFTAYGPAFKSNFTTDHLNNVDLYSLFAKLLGLPLPNNSHNGNMNNVNALFEDTPQRSSDLNAKWIIIIILAGCVILLGVIALRNVKKKHTFQDFA